MDSRTFYATYAGPPPALVFIDGDHAYPAVQEDIGRARETGAALIGGHDYAPGTPGVIQAVEEHFPRATVQVGTVWMWGLPQARMP